MRTLRPRSVVVAVLLTLLGAQSAGCMEHQVDGKTARDEFSDPGLARLARASCEGDLPGVAAALKDGANPNGKGLKGVTPLLWAVNCENLAGMDALLKAGADPNQIVDNSFSPTYAAATMWNPALLKLLLKHGGDPDAHLVGDVSDSALYQAFTVGADGKGWDNYYALLDAGADIDRADEAGITIAMRVAAHSDYDKVAELLERGYSFDLPALGALVLVTEIDPQAFPKAAAAKARVVEMLKQRGVILPAPRAVSSGGGARP